MREVQTKDMPATPGAKLTISGKDTTERGRRYRRAILEVDVGFRRKTDGAGAMTIKAADVRDAFACLFANVTMMEGIRTKRIIDNALAFEVLRRMLRISTTEDVLVFDETGTPNAVRLDSYANDTDPVTASVAEGATERIRIQYVRSFVLDVLGEDGEEFALGSTQAASLRFEVKRGSDFQPTNNRFEQDGAASFSLLWDDDDADGPDADDWAPIVRVLRTNETGLMHDGPSGALLGLVETSAAGFSTALDRFTLAREGDTEIHKNVTAERVINLQELETDPGAFDLNEEVTVLYALRRHARIRDLLTSDKFRFEQVSPDLSPANLEWFYIPAEPPEDVQRAAAVVFETDTDTRTVKMSGKWSDTHAVKRPHLACIQPLRVLRPADTDFRAPIAGSEFQKSGDGAIGAPSIPAGVKAAAGSAVGGGITAAGREAQAERMTVAVARSVPAALSPRRGRRDTEGLDAVRALTGLATAAQ